ncbi:hypothetical protein HDU92_001008 [Lobulomyces angularis]|nr:hypothetical protein HDU92_001008 [Lobulomyces angularis]
MLKFISSISVSFAPVNKNSKSARSFVYLMNTKKNLESNLKCKVSITSKDEIENPSISVVYVDKKSLKMDAAYMTAAEMVKDINKHTKYLQLQEDIQQSS